MEGSGGGDAWSDAVEDLIDRGDIEGAISVLESVISNLETQDPSPPSDDLRLACALGDLADLHSSRGFSLKADDLRSRALLIRTRPLNPPTPRDFEPVEEKIPELEEIRVPSSSHNGEENDDDWEAIADRAGSNGVSLSLQHEVGAPSSSSREDTELGTPSPSREETEPGIPKRRGRGSFLYRKNGLFSDQPDDGIMSGNNSGSEDDVSTPENHLDDESAGVRKSISGASHVLVLYDFPPSTRTIDLEKLFVSFRDRGVAIRWVSDTVALAVFRTPAIAHEAQSSVNCTFKVRRLDEQDSLLSQISTKDLEPPYPRPKTSVRTAQRLIAQGMGLKPSSSFGSNELKKQEEARKNRIHTRQIMRDEAWGSDEV